MCSDDLTFVSEYEYTVMALRLLNCLHHRSLGIEEIDFEFIDQVIRVTLVILGSCVSSKLFFLEIQ